MLDGSMLQESTSNEELVPDLNPLGRAKDLFEAYGCKSITPQ